MQSVLYIHEVDQAAALLKPSRLALLERLAEPRSCPELASALGETTQRVYYHVKVLEKQGLVTKVGERRAGAIMEGLYQATARSYWMSPELVGRVGGPRKTRSQLSLDHLLALTEEVQGDVGRLAERAVGEDVPSLGLSAQIELRDESEREAFMKDVRRTFESLAEKYGATHSGQNNPGSPSLFRMALACYPKGDDDE